MFTSSDYFQDVHKGVSEMNKLSLFFCLSISISAIATTNVKIRSKKCGPFEYNYNEENVFIIQRHYRYLDPVYVQEHCKKCFDADIITDTNFFDNFSDENYPSFFGISLAVNETEWKWMTNGSKVENWDKFALKIRNLSGTLAQDKTNGLMVTQVNDDVGVATIFWTPRREFAKVVCQRQRRYQCHVENLNDSGCLYLKKFGCHKYVSTLSYGDNETCKSPEIVYKALQCDMSNCTFCNVTNWSEWGECSLRRCNDAPGKMTRVRKLVEPCTEGMYKDFELSEKKDCTILGCDELLDPLLENHAKI